MRKYPRLDPEDPIEQGLLKATLVTKSWPDIAKRLQKIEGWNEKPIEELLRRSESLHKREETQKQKASGMVSAVDEVVRRRRVRLLPADTEKR